MKWLFLVHQVHTSNSRERVKVWRSIKKIGAVLHRNSVYVLPFSKERLEDFQWVCQQINDSKGEASVFVSEAQDVKEDRLLRKLFDDARQEEYGALLKVAEKLYDRIIAGKNAKRFTPSQLRSLEKEAKQLGESLDDIREVDFFYTSPPRKLSWRIDEVKKALASCKPEVPTARPLKYYDPADFKRKVWTTREGIHIDRICSAWFIRRFIDPSAKFVFAPESRLPKDAIPFDVLGAEFSHRGEDCTFETLMKSFRIQDGALSEIAQIVHDVDLKDRKFGRAEATGIDVIIRALADSLADDKKVLEIGSVVFDCLYEFYLKKIEKSAKQK